MNVIAPRFCPVYGLGQWYGSGGAVFMATCVEGPALGKSVTIDTPFANLNQYLYVEDAARAIVQCWTAKSPAERANIGSGVLHSAPQVIDVVKAAIPGARVDIAPDTWAACKDRRFVRPAVQPEPRPRRAGIRTQDDPGASRRPLRRPGAPPGAAGIAASLVPNGRHRQKKRHART